MFSLRMFNRAMQSLGSVKAVGIMLVGAAILSCSPKLDWRTVNTERLGYTALFPEKPKQAERNLPYAGLELQQTLEVVQIDDAIMSITTIAVPSSINAQAGALLEQVQKAILQSANALQTQPMKHPSQYVIAGPSRSKGLAEDYLFEIQNPSGKRWMRVRWIMRPDGEGGSRIYQQSLLILAPANAKVFQSELTAEKWDPFFDEFRVQ
ncbi:hypothetical protein [Polynucleobacter sp.]|uniref:hypothetical protein n=1 Tax=Polynucleobacter sp. TaxID=2029855 RepID=UPI0027367229|nr:hypothetical protein [Polynucleobacter sp.]MDP3121672.1 hypothetical protein [Polynucleobacter sp.]